MLVSTCGQVWDCVEAYETTAVHYDELEWVEKIDTLRMCRYFETEAERQKAIEDNENEETFKYKRSLYQVSQDRCKLADGMIELADVRHIQWKDSSSLELQLVETHPPTDHTMGTTSYVNLLLLFESVVEPPTKRAKKTVSFDSEN